jgi:hypothetical protein
MALDIYVGPLCRYYTGAWSTVVQRSAPGRAVEVRDEHPDEEGAIRDPAQARPLILAWLESLRMALRTHDVEVLWKEEPEGEYFTDRPAWDCYGSLLLWAAYSEQPELRRPECCPDDWSEDPALSASREKEFATGFPHLLQQTEFWVPGTLSFVFRAPDPVGEPVYCGSVEGLCAELEQINEEAWSMDAAAMELVRREGSELGASLDHAARFCVAVLLPLARLARAKQLPIKLDY